MKKNNKIPRSPRDTLYQLYKQYKFLCRAILAVREGDLDETDRIALALRILFHSSRHSKSLLSQIQPGIQLLDTCSSIPLPPCEDETTDQKFMSSYGFKGGMVCIALGSRKIWELTPPSSPSWVGIEEWWNRVLFIDEGIEFSRKKLVLCISDTDGGAHVDDELEQSYFSLSRFGSIGMQFFIKGMRHIPNGPEKVILPHIDLEVVNSLKRAFPDICTECGLPEISEN